MEGTGKKETRSFHFKHRKSIIVVSKFEMKGAMAIDPECFVHFKGITLIYQHLPNVSKFE